jgi:hypothetical protein
MAPNRSLTAQCFYCDSKVMDYNVVPYRKRTHIWYEPIQVYLAMVCTWSCPCIAVALYVFGYDVPAMPSQDEPANAQPLPVFYSHLLMIEFEYGGGCIVKPSSPK